MVKQSDCNVASLTKVVQSHISTAELKSLINKEVSYILPESESAIFPALFIELDNRKNQLGISTFDISASTTEEISLNPACANRAIIDYKVGGPMKSCVHHQWSTTTYS
ncbi:ATP-binding cassette sub-family a member 3 [Plakobranchus ocellatus]|uniref:ATP-binding cassette sub-family a member 3 n=1 Tax=Plakobranchus ocellatus TaxID=259542 RepID=A0AAV4C5B7_9GAST|nr:ATP-binding cassette sub-family a member 3 [Plakobranchus ocellatus]